MTDPLNIAVLGSTGSIGKSALEVVASMPDRLNVVGLSAHGQLDLLAEQVASFAPDWIVATCPSTWKQWTNKNQVHSSIHVGSEAIDELVAGDSIDCVVAAIVGSAGLPSTLAAVKAGKRVALANKETLVMAGATVNQLAQESGAEILPVDSEHNALFQCLKSGAAGEVERLILTASGGPFRKSTLEEIQKATVEQALAHPTWKMGKKTTIDSATMMNKSLELIEARWLFDLPAEKLEVMVHPQSIVHSMVEFVDGSVMAQMSPPDMKLPIQYALTYPDRLPGPARKMNWSKTICLEMFPPDPDKFPSIELGYEVARRGGTTGAVVNAANEAAVAAFLDRKINFMDIARASRDVLNHHDFETNPTLQNIIDADAWARQEIAKWISA